MKLVTATAATATATTATTVATTTTAAATTTALAGLGFVDGQGTAIVLLLVHSTDRLLSSIIRLHLDKAKALASTSVAILDDLRAYYRAELREQLF